MDKKKKEKEKHTHTRFVLRRDQTVKEKNSSKTFLVVLS